MPTLLSPGETAFIAGGTGEPTAFLAEWRQHQSLRKVTFVGVQVPGLNSLTPEHLGEECRVVTNFLAPGLRSGLAGGAVSLLPLHHTAFYDWLRGPARIDTAVFQVSPPDSAGMCNLGPCTDLLPAVLERPEVRLVAQINPQLPACRDGVTLPFERLDAYWEKETGLPELEGSSFGAESPIAAHVAGLVADGATVQIGIGRLPDQVLARLQNRRQLKLHGGTVSAAGLALLESGAVESIVAGTALGDAAFYRRVAAAEKMAFRPVSITHGAGSLSRIRQLTAINAALEVDLFGQANCEAVGGRLVTSFGGLNDFLRAARQSPGGRSVLILPATAADGRVSRIVARLGDPGLVSVQRGDVDTVVTEHGVADLRELDLDARAAALIEIAAPNFRNELSEKWDRMRRGLA